MVQSIDSLFNRPVYNAVNIKINKPEVNSKDNENLSLITDNGIYNAVKIRIDNPSINPNKEQKIYDYPEAKGIVTYDMAGIRPVMPVTLYSASAHVAVPEEAAQEQAPEVPEPAFTTVEAEKKADTAVKDDTQKEESLKEDAIKDDNANVQFHGAAKAEKPEIVPSEEIKPEVDMKQLISNLKNEDYDVQAQQMEEIVRMSLDGEDKLMPYIVKDVFTNIMDIANKDTSALSGPSQEQIEIRNKIIANVIAAQSKGVKKLPYQLTKEQVTEANKLSPMEMAERNKEYALFTLAVLAKGYVDGVEKETGNVVPITDVPGVSTMIDTLRVSTNPSIKASAIESLVYIQRPEYKQELSTVFEIAKSDKNPLVAETAKFALNEINKA